MIRLIIILSIIFLEIFALWLSRILKNKDKSILKILAILFIIVYSIRLITSDAFDDIKALSCDYLSASSVIFMLILRAMTLVCVMVTSLTPFYKCNATQNILRYITPLIVLLNIIFYISNIQCIYGTSELNIFSFRSIQFALEIIFMGVISIFYLVKSLKKFNREYKKFFKTLLKSLGIFGLLILAVLPVSFFNILFGSFGGEADDFSFTHRMMLYFTVIVGLIIYYSFKSKGKELKEIALIYMATACLIQFCYTIDINSLTWSNLPLHLCNTAVFLIFIAYVFRIKSVFYFTFFVNVIGGIFAILIPNTSGSLFEWYNIRFWYNHIYVIILPILGVLWNVYARPNLKMMKGAIIIFSIYFVSMIFANAYINAFGSVDYFFLQGDTISQHADFLRRWQLNYILTIKFAGISYSTAWVYDIFLYFGYIILMFIIWLIYVNLFKVQDHYAEVSRFSRQDKLEQREVKRKLFGNLSKPLNPRSKKMINISHFSKIYGSTGKKAVDDFSLKIKEGEVFGFLGHNGAGKSTVIKSMVGIQNITEGKIEICGYDIQKQPLQAKSLIGYVSDNHTVYEHLTGREYVNYVADLYNIDRNKRTTIMDKYVDLFSLNDAFDNPIKSYSHGMKQKVVVIAALVHEPKVWILDEPLTGLDPTSAFQIKECMREHADKGNIVFFSSHVIEVVEKICDKIAIIKQGKLQGTYSIKELKSKNIDLEELYMSFVDVKTENNS